MTLTFEDLCRAFGLRQSLLSDWVEQEMGATVKNYEKLFELQARKAELMNMQLDLIRVMK